tara:strand:+ start:466 stop:678 length:213 start_codon:yes stop_codon:yes gene_type:complete
MIHTLNEINTIRSKQAGRVIGLMQFLNEKWEYLDSDWVKSKLEEMVKEDAETDKLIQNMLNETEGSEIHG